MERLRLAPGPPLSRFVELLWYYRNDPQPHAKERLMPDGCVSIVINLAEDQTRLYDPDDTRKMFTLGGCTLSGPQTKSFAIDTDEQNHVVGISFRPAGAVPFLKLPSTELCDQHLELGDLWGSFARQLRDRVLEAPTPVTKLRALELALLQRAGGMFDDHPAVEYAVKTFLRAPQTANITRIVTETGFSSRRFIELFKHHVGLPPKLFCRVRRFQSVLRRITSGRPVRWTDVALDCGYFDQAHFIHDFRGFSGINPSKYLSDHSGFPGHHNHLPILP
jgi:AraC-like DNA-binding protein